MTHVLFVVRKPDEPAIQSSSPWRVFLNDVEHSAKTSAKTSEIAEGCWLIPLGNELHVLSALVVAAKKAQFPYKALLIDGDLRWLK